MTRFATPGTAYAETVRKCSDGAAWNAALITANRGRPARMNQDDKRAVWIAIKEAGGVEANS